MTLFCPQGHLLLRREDERLILLTRCPHCGWQPSGGDEAGKVLWQVDLKAPLAGPTRRMYARPVAHRGLLFLPLANGELVALRLSDGKQVWRTTLGAAHLLARTLTVATERLLALVLDTRTMGDAHALAEIDATTGRWHPLFASQGQLVGLAPFGSGVLSRNSEGVFYLAPSGSGWDVVWQVEVSFSTVPPVGIAEQQVWAITYDIRRGTGACVALDGHDGRRLWETPLPPALARAHAGLRAAPIPGGAVWSGERARGVWAVDAASGATRWLGERRAYTPPVFDGETVWVVVRGPKPSGTPGHYVLLGLDPADGHVVAEHPLPRRVLASPQVVGRSVVLSDEEGFTLAVDTASGEILWEVQLGEAGEPPGMAPLPVPDGVVAGSFNGRLALLSAGRPAYQEMVPEERLAAGDVEGAALVYALQGNLPEAADLYAERLRQPRRAVTLLAFDGRLQEALQLAQKHALWDEVERLAAQAGDMPAEAEARERRGDRLGAARVWEQVGSSEALARAADLYEQAGAAEEAWRLRKALGQVSWLERLVRGLGFKPLPEDWEAYAHQVGAPQAAVLLMEQGLYERAAEFYARAGDLQGQLKALRHHAEALPPEQAQGVWEEVALLARRAGEFRQEARAWEQADERSKAADAYYRAARQVETRRQRKQGKETQAVGLYLQFLRLMGLSEEQVAAPPPHLEEQNEVRLACERVLQARRWPRLTIAALSSQEALREGEFGVLHITLRNDGYGEARHIVLEVRDEGRFEVDKRRGTWEMPFLGEKREAHFTLYLRPLPGQAGVSVPLALAWQWQDKEERDFRREQSFPVKVHRAGSTSGMPVAPTSSGVPIVQSGTVIYVQNGGSYVAGDYVAKGAQKGDRVEIRRGAAAEPSPLPPGRDVVSVDDHRIRLHTGADQAAAMPLQKGERPCPVCGLTIPDDVAVCPYCGNPVGSSEPG